jgi:hypothetical protein
VPGIPARRGRVDMKVDWAKGSSPSKGSMGTSGTGISTYNLMSVMDAPAMCISTYNLMSVMDAPAMCISTYNLMSVMDAPVMCISTYNLMSVMDAPVMCISTYNLMSVMDAPVMCISTYNLTHRKRGGLCSQRRLWGSFIVNISKFKEVLSKDMEK